MTASAGMVSAILLHANRLGAEGTSAVLLWSWWTSAGSATPVARGGIHGDDGIAVEIVTGADRLRISCRVPELTGMKMRITLFVDAMVSTPDVETASRLYSSRVV